jgi:hypothetical protein
MQSSEAWAMGLAARLKPKASESDIAEFVNLLKPLLIATNLRKESFVQSYLLN